MKETMHATTSQPEREHSLRKRLSLRCSICTRHLWFDPVWVTEPADAPEPQHTWTLCRECYEALERELHRSPLTTPLRTRIAVGLIAAERSPTAYPTQLASYIYARRWIVFIAAGCIIAMLLHLALIIFIVLISG
jgi:hypothetical protein